MQFSFALIHIWLRHPKIRAVSGSQTMSSVLPPTSTPECTTVSCINMYNMLWNMYNKSRLSENSYVCGAWNSSVYKLCLHTMLCLTSMSLGTSSVVSARGKTKQGTELSVSPQPFLNWLFPVPRQISKFHENSSTTFWAILLIVDDGKSQTNLIIFLLHRG